MDRDIQEVLITEEQIASRLTEIAKDISSEYRHTPLARMCLTNGANIFAAELMRAIAIPLRLASIAVSSYRGTESPGMVTLE